MASNNFLSALYCFNYDGKYVNFPFFQDIGGVQITYVTYQTNLPLEGGGTTAGFIVYAQDEKGIQQHQYWLKAQGFVASLAALQTELNSLGQQNSFTLYTGLVSVQGFSSPSLVGGNILISDLHTQTRVLDPFKNQTIITLDIYNNLSYFQIVVQGDQTTAGLYYYNVYL